MLGGLQKASAMGILSAIRLSLDLSATGKTRKTNVRVQGEGLECLELESAKEREDKIPDLRNSLELRMSCWPLDQVQKVAFTHRRFDRQASQIRELQ